ncbi:transposase [Kouleothrix aurantiaca]|uniref:Transposase n=1 Tax=Kouleothrix aurantiaca TaxID=186479 RepID=A0A0P9DH40_9CHLR|nr:transposase [Kouleothrix aurantiaca]
MRLVEHHRIDRHDPRFAAIDAAAFASKNLYNAANYVVRQAYIFRAERIHYPALAHQMRQTEPYRALPAKVAQWVLKQVRVAWESYFAAVSAWKADPSRFLGRPRLPKYLGKQGRNVLTYTIQAISRPLLRQGIIQPSGLPIQVQTRQTAVQQVRIVPHGTHYTIEVVYQQPITPAPLDPALVAAIDIGVNNLAALTASLPGFVPRLINGRPLKALNQFYNKRRAQLQARLQQNRHTSRRLDAITDKRNRRITDYLHNASRAIINLLVQHRIGTLVIGHNPNWKQRVRLGRRTNQTFVFIPHARFIAMLTYKAEIVGICVLVHEEAHTSKVSFLDNEPVQHHAHYAGKRIARGLFRASDGRLINADVNGSYNIGRKAAPDAFGPGGRGWVVQPVPLVLPNRQRQRTNPALVS